MIPRPTTRGTLVLIVGVFALGMRQLFGGDALEVVVVSTVLLVGTTGMLVARFDPPSVRRSLSPSGHQDERIQVDLWVESRRSYPASIHDETADGLEEDGPRFAITDGRRLEYDLELNTRGRHTVGPATVTAYDPFKLWKRTFTSGGTQTVTVFPRVDPIRPTGTVVKQYVEQSRDRSAFDGIRPYQPGDPLRDVNWKATAKRQGSLIVTEYAGSNENHRPRIGVECDWPRADGAARAAASLASFLLENGFEVGLLTEERTLAPASGPGHRRRVFEHLAGLSGSSLDGTKRERADVLIEVHRGGEQVSIRSGPETVGYDEVAADSNWVTVGP
ncbi:MAG: DUF58 domain-containing protein [Halodesulfurarchaeum sp.]